MVIKYPFDMIGIECPEYKTLPDYERVDNIVLSVIVTTYNRAPILGYSLESIICQDFPKEMYEIFIVDDASDIGDQEVIKKFMEKHDDYNIRAILLKESKTFNEHGTVNIAIKRCSGDIYVRHQADLFYMQNDYLSGIYRHHLVRDDIWVNGIPYGYKPGVVDGRITAKIHEVLDNGDLSKIRDLDMQQVFSLQWGGEPFLNKPLEMGSSVRKKWAFGVCGYNEQVIGNIPADVPFMCNICERGVKFCVDTSLAVLHMPYVYKRSPSYDEDKEDSRKPVDGDEWHRTKHPWGELSIEDISPDVNYLLNKRGLKQNV